MGETTDATEKLDRVRPFLLNFSVDAHGPPLPAMVYDETRDLNVVLQEMRPLCLSKYFLATQTKTEVGWEDDDDDD